MQAGSDMAKMMIPKFETESEEAQWWYDNREALAVEFVEALRNGQGGEGSLGRMKRIQERKARELGQQDFGTGVSAK